MEFHKYRNFVVTASHRSSFSPDQFEVSVGALAPGPAPENPEPEIVTKDPNFFTVSTNGQEMSLLDVIKRRPVPAERLYDLGRRLSDLVLPGRVRQHFLKSLDTVRTQGQRLRLRLVLDSALAPLPWEYLCIEITKGAALDTDFLALNQDISIVRLELVGAPEAGLPRGSNYRLVAASSSPADQDPLDLEADRRAITNALEKAGNFGSVTPVWVPHATPESLEKALAQGCDIFHFSGHGLFFQDKGQIVLENSDGKRSQPYDAGKLGQLLRDAQTKIAILGACETAQRTAENRFGGIAASLVGQGLSAVVASQYRLLDKNALPLAEQLYISLLSGQEIDDGVYQARKRIFQNSGLENRDWGSLVLYLRVEDGIVFPRQAPSDRTRSLGPRVAPTPLQMPLIGISAELASIQQELAPGKNYYLHGEFGVGKTSMATDLFTTAINGKRFEDGWIWGNAAGMSADRLLEWLAANFPEQRVSTAKTRSEKVNALRNLLAGYPNLLIGLDDVSSIDAARAVLDAAGAGAVMLNGVASYSLGGKAREVKMKPLSQGAAEELFLSLAALSISGTQAGEDRRLIRDICERMHYLPLGVKLAALKCAEGESLGTLWERLESNPELVGDEQIRVLFESIYDELAASPVAQRLLVRLASFPTFEAALDPLRQDADDLAFFQAKDKLIALGLMTTTGPDRLAQHPLLGRLVWRKAASALVSAEGLFAETWLLRYAHDNQSCFDSLKREQANLIGLLNALGRARRWNDIAQLMRDLFDYLRVRGMWQEAFARLDACLKHEMQLSAANRGWAYLHRGILSSLLGRYDRANSDFDHAAGMYAAKCDKPDLGRVFYWRAIVSAAIGGLPRAEKQFRRALNLMSLDAPAADRAGAHSRLGDVLAQRGSSRNALKEHDKGLAIAHEAGAVEQEIRILLARGRLNEQAGKIESAKRDFQHAVELATSLGDSLQLALIQLSIGYLEYHAARFDEALANFLAALTKFRELGYESGISRGLHALGNAALARGDSQGAAVYYNEALKLNERLGQVGGAAYNRYQLGVAAHREGRRDEAVTCYNQALRAARQNRDRSLEAAALAQLAKAARECGDFPGAAKYSIQARDLAIGLGDNLSEGVALFQLSLTQAETGDLGAGVTLAAAHAIFAAFGGREASIVLETSKVNPVDRVLDQARPTEPAPLQVVGKSIDRVVEDGSVAASIDRVIDAPFGGFGSFGGAGGNM